METKVEETLQTDEELIRASQQGSQEAFKQLVQRYYQHAYAMAFYWTHNREVALDISQESFVRVYRHLRKFDFNRSFKTWLFTIVKRLALNYLERHRRRWTVFSDYFSGNRSHKIPEAPADERFAHRELQQQVWEALRQLEDKDRDIILLKDFEDFSYKEISEALGIPVGTVMSRLFHARKKLAKIIEELNRVPE